MNSNYFKKEQEMANDRFFGADGFADDNNFYGNDYSADGFADYNFYGNTYSADGAGCPAPMKVQSSVPYVFQIANSTASDVAGVVLLGANQNTINSATNFGNAAAITITMQNGAVSYAQFLESLKSQTFLIGEVQMQSANTTQPFNTITIAQSDPNGATSSLPYTPVIDPYQNQSGVSVFKQLIPVNGWTQFSFTLLASPTVTARLFPAQTIDTSRALVNANVSRVYNNPQISAPAIRTVNPSALIAR